MRQHLLEDIRSHALAKPNQFAVCDSKVSINYGALDTLQHQRGNALASNWM